MECSYRAERELTHHAESHAQNQHERVGEGGHKGGDQAEILIELGKSRGLRVDRGLEACPALKITVLRAAGLDGLHHLDTGDRGGRQLALIASLDARDVNSL